MQVAEQTTPTINLSQTNISSLGTITYQDSNTCVNRFSIPRIQHYNSNLMIHQRQQSQNISNNKIKVEQSKPPSPKTNDPSNLMPTLQDEINIISNEEKSQITSIRNISRVNSLIKPLKNSSELFNQHKKRTPQNEGDSPVHTKDLSRFVSLNIVINSETINTATTPFSEQQVFVEQQVFIINHLDK